MFFRELLTFSAGFLMAAICITVLCVLFRFDFRTLSGRVDELEDDVHKLEGFFEFNADGSVRRVSDLFFIDELHLKPEETKKDPD